MSQNYFEENSDVQNQKQLMYNITDESEDPVLNGNRPHSRHQAQASSIFDEDDDPDLLNRLRVDNSSSLFQEDESQPLFPQNFDSLISDQEERPQYTENENELRARTQLIHQKHILKKQKSKKKIKNGNMPKFVTRLLFDRGVQYLDDFGANDALKKEFVEFTRREKQKCKEDKNRNNRVCDILRIFGHTMGNFREIRRSSILRKIMNQILRAHLTEHVIMNPQVKLTKEYLISLKVYGLRCRNLNLMERMEFR